MSFDHLAEMFLPSIENELHVVVDLVDGPHSDGLKRMLVYHMGWEGEGAGPEARGKRIRPLLVLLTTAAAGGEWKRALPAAAAVELVHNFSLIHDDIEDNSPTRHGRSTVWKKWGVAQAINAGDAMFTLAHLATLRLQESAYSLIAFKATQILQNGCLRLTQGQYMDLAYEARGDLSVEAYWPMVSGKTAALISACTELGALVAETSGAAGAAYREFGYSLGLAFQAQDDLLGIWGDAAITGKSAESDLLSGKKSLPVLLGLSQNGPFAARWNQGPITPNEVPGLALQLEQEGVYVATQEQATKLTNQALGALELANPQGEAGQALRELARRLLQRQG
jgi:geranylgeranyl diphosphate synthase, type I